MLKISIQYLFCSNVIKLLFKIVPLFYGPESPHGFSVLMISGLAINKDNCQFWKKWTDIQIYLMKLVNKLFLIMNL